MASFLCCCSQRITDNSYLLAESTERNDDVCRICYEGGPGLIAPCLCTGGSKWIHRTCLDKWRTTRMNPNAFTHCSTCNYKYRVCWRDPGLVSKRVKLCLYLTRDITSFLLIIEALIIIVSAITFGIDQATGNNIWKLFPYESWPQLAKIGVYHLAGIIFFFALLGIAALLFACLLAVCGSPRSCSNAELSCYGLYCCWFGLPCHPYYFYYPVSPVMAPAGACAGCGGTNCRCDTGGNHHVLLILLVIVLVVLVIIGIVFAIIVLVFFIHIVLRRHTDILYRRERAKEEIVCDLSMYEHSTINNLPEVLEYEGVPHGEA